MRRRNSTVLAATVALGICMDANYSLSNTLTFEGPVCTVSCNNGVSIQQGYGDVLGVVDVQYNRNVNNNAYTTGAVGSEMFFWSTGYSNLANVAYGEVSGASLIFLKPLNGQAVQLNGLDLGVWPNGTQTSQVTIVDGLGNILFSSGSVSVGGAVASHFSFSLLSATGIGIKFGPISNIVGIDNIDFSLVNAPGVPLPAALPLFGAGISVLVLVARRSKRRNIGASQKSNNYS